MKTKITLLCILLIAASIVSTSYFNDEKTSITSKKISKNSSKNLLNNNYNKIICDGIVYRRYPTFDSINPDIAKTLKSLPKLDVDKDFLWGGEIDKRLSEKMFSSFIKNFNKNNIFSDYKTRIDGAKILWAPMYLLPTNGKFIMLVMQYWDEEFDARSSGYFLCTFNLNGELLSMVYAYGQEELDRSGLNKDLLINIWGRAYCLNTNKPTIRKAKCWDYYSNRNGFRGATIEIKEFKYSIDDNGIVKLDKENLIFPRKEVKWKDRSGVSFEDNSDTIKKMLGISGKEMY